MFLSSYPQAQHAKHGNKGNLKELLDAQLDSIANASDSLLCGLKDDMETSLIIVDYHQADPAFLGQKLAHIDAQTEDASSRKSAIVSFLISSDVGKALVEAARAHHQKFTMNPVRSKLLSVEQQLEQFLGEEDEGKCQILTTKIKAQLEDIDKAVTDNTTKLKKKELSECTQKLASCRDLFQKAAFAWACWHANEHLMNHWNVI